MTIITNNLQTNEWKPFQRDYSWSFKKRSSFFIVSFHRGANFGTDYAFSQFSFRCRTNFGTDYAFSRFSFRCSINFGIDYAFLQFSFRCRANFGINSGFSQFSFRCRVNFEGYLDISVVSARQEKCRKHFI